MRPSDDPIRYSFEYAERIRICFIGAGGHSFRNVYPSLRYAPVDLVAVCDLQPERAAEFARMFGAQRHYTDHREMLAAERPDAVFIVTGKLPDGRPQATQLALDALAMGVHVWMEKPTAASSAEVAALTGASAASGRFVMTGLKKIFFPAVQKVKQVIESADFGRASSISVRYPQGMPAFEERSDPQRLESLLDHIYHPAAILHFLMGPIAHMSYEWEPFNGGSITSLRFTSGAIGTLHLTAGQSGSSPLERLEVIGEGANIVVDNGVKVTYYRRAEPLAYGRSPSFLVDDEVAPLHWEPEFSLGQLYNKNLFYLGYVPEILYFCDRVTSGQPPEHGGLAQVAEIVKLYESYRDTPPATVRVLNPQEAS